MVPIKDLSWIPLLQNIIILGLQTIISRNLNITETGAVIWSVRKKLTLATQQCYSEELTMNGTDKQPDSKSSRYDS
jgi:hypothetical protein